MNRINEESLKRIFGSVEIATLRKRIQGKPLTQTERNYLSRSIRPKLMAARQMTEAGIMAKIRRPEKGLEEKIAFNLSRYGYEMIALKMQPRNRPIGLEELIAIILTRCPQPRFIEAIPIILLKNKTDKFRLAEIAYSEGIINKMGYLIETAVMIAGRLGLKTDLKDILSHLEKNKETRISALSGEKDDVYMEFLSRTTPKRMAKWNLLGRFFDEDFIKISEVYL